MSSTIHEIMFSPTGGTAAVVKELSLCFEGERRITDLLARNSTCNANNFEKTDLCVLAAPVFGGRIPPLAAERIKRLHGNGARAVLVCVYGNRAYEDALLELYDVAKEAGFRPFAAVTAVAAHSIMKQYASGRPDEQDRERLYCFGRQIWDIFLRSDLDETLLKLPGRRPYKEYRAVPMLPLTSADCLGCNVCADACPAGAILPGSPGKIEPSLCISCMHCIAICPQQAVYLDEEKVQLLAERLAAQFAARKECELFLPEQRERTARLLREHVRTYPELRAQDLLKFLHQSAFGCEHLVSSLESATVSIEKEYTSACQAGELSDRAVTEPLAGDYGRVSLSCLKEGLCADTLAKLFIASSKKEAGSNRLLPMIEIAEELAREGDLSIPYGELESAIAKWAAEGYPAVRHSDVFREKYHPAYRVIAAEYIPFLTLFAEIDKRLAAADGRIVVAIEGGSASGKTTLSKRLEEIYACTVFHMDDFFLQAHQRSPERYAQAGGNIDHERFLTEVLQPLRRGEKIKYRKFDCATLSLGEREEVVPGRLVIVEGAYSMHPQLQPYYDYSAYLDISPQLQRERIRYRNTPRLAERFFREWIPLEHVYFNETNVKERCGMVIEVR